MAKMATKHSPRQLESRRDRERIMFGTQGAASSVRHVDWIPEVLRGAVNERPVRWDGA